MAAVMTLYPSFFEAMGKGQINLQTADLRLALMGSGFTPNDENSVWGDVSAHEISGINYTQGGRQLTGKVVSLTGRRAKLAADNVVWPELTANFHYGVLYSLGNGNPLVARIVFHEVEEVRVSGLDYLVSWHSDGVVSWGDPV
ncbi:hypothetical protein OOT00_15840 [Desulfobotulus sp. H1]|uniref:Uncharacterized protein n=1 Tax=Desulfobotulus pelophilus TaxID=2823377 RepID=A0ABT3NDB1_9BACT|nr:hypothetical protein [Desulfobotulus pelophilus]MCW7755448.1 hypothetical protein [Desulfobotulus pelophilus]